MKYYVYELIDGNTNLPFYVGKGCEKRMYSHINCVKNGYIPHGNKYLFNKIKSILDSDNVIIHRKIFVSEDEQEVFLMEMKRIKEIGIEKLCNLTYGGEGNSPTQEVREKISETLTGHSVSKETREKISKKLKGKVFPHMIGRKMSQEARNKMSLAKKNRTPWNKGLKGIYSQETLKKISKARSGKTYEEIYGKGRSDEIKETSRQRMLKNNPMKKNECVQKYIESTTGMKYKRREVSIND